jgi:HK97 family phage major capsid protein
MARLAYKMSVTQEKAYLTGDGNQKPLGVFTASATTASPPAATSPPATRPRRSPSTA